MVSKAARRTIAADGKEPARRVLLLVDDEPLFGRALQRTLQRHHEVVVVGSASAALDLVQSGKHYDLIISDLMMPKMSGIDLYHQLLSLSPLHAHRMIFLTGGAFLERAEAFLQRVPNLHLEKPCDTRSLLKAIDRMTAEVDPSKQPPT
jgi:CheY-like chemotaxis protein